MDTEKKHDSSDWLLLLYKSILKLLERNGKVQKQALCLSVKFYI